MMSVDSWRDYRDELTPAQIQELETWENRSTGWPELAVALAQAARDHAQRNRLDVERFGHVAIPAGAFRVSHWEPDEMTALWWREVTSFTRVIEFPEVPSDFLEITVTGDQYVDGIRGAGVWIEAECLRLRPDDARKIAAVLVEAASEADRLAAL